MEVQVTRIDAQSLRELAIRHRRLGLAQRLEHAQAERMPERLELLGTVDDEDLRDRSGLGVGRARRGYIYAAGNTCV